MTSHDLDREIEAFVREAFERNYEELRTDGGRLLSPDGKEMALQHVLLYWRKLREVAESVTDAEVKLSLPGCKSPKGRDFSIEGVVDIVREVGRTVMYDIKTHDERYVRQNKQLYEKQLNVYAYIWQELRGESLDETAVIATVFPEEVAEALAAGDEQRLAEALDGWDPLIPLECDASSVAETVRDFGQVVDLIEDGVFGPRSVEHLNTRQGSTGERFATAVCRNCDARFSCESYRRWALSGVSRSRIERRFRQYFGDLSDREVEAWHAANQAAAAEPEDVRQDFVG